MPIETVDQRNEPDKENEGADDVCEWCDKKKEEGERHGPAICASLEMPAVNAGEGCGLVLFGFLAVAVPLAAGVSIFLSPDVLGPLRGNSHSREVVSGAFFIAK